MLVRDTAGTEPAGAARHDPKQSNTNSYRFNEDELEWYRSHGCEEVKICAGAGDLIRASRWARLRLQIYPRPPLPPFLCYASFPFGRAAHLCPRAYYLLQLETHGVKTSATHSQYGTRARSTGTHPPPAPNPASRPTSSTPRALLMSTDELREKRVIFDRRKCTTGWPVSFPCYPSPRRAIANPSCWGRATYSVPEQQDKLDVPLDRPDGKNLRPKRPDGSLDPYDRTWPRRDVVPDAQVLWAVGVR